MDTNLSRILTELKAQPINEAFKEWVTLEGGAEVFLDDSKTGICKSCKEKFNWGVTRTNKFMPVVKDASGKWVSHFSNCPGAGAHRLKINKER